MFLCMRGLGNYRCNSMKLSGGAMRSETNNKEYGIAVRFKRKTSLYSNYKMKKKMFFYEM